MTPDHGGKREGAGRQPLYDEPATQIRLTLPDRLIDKLSEMAGDGDMSVRVAQLLEDAK